MTYPQVIVIFSNDCIGLVFVVLRLLRWHCKLTMERSVYSLEVGSVRLGLNSPGSGYSVMAWIWKTFCRKSLQKSARNSENDKQNLLCLPP